MCAGYETTFQIASRSRQGIPESAMQCFVLDSSPAAGSSAPPLSLAIVDATAPPMEREMFAYFNQDVAPHVAGIFDLGFWKSHVPQSARHYKAIWHACNASAASHLGQRRYPRNEPPPSAWQDEARKRELDTFALQQYGAAIQALMQMTQKLDLTTAVEREQILIANSLLVTYACSNRDLQGTMVHVMNGLNLLQQWRKYDAFRRASTKAKSSKKRKQKDGHSPEIEGGIERQQGVIRSADSLLLIYLRLEDMIRDQQRRSALLAPKPRPNPVFTSLLDVYYELMIITHGMAETDPSQTAIGTLPAQSQSQPMPTADTLARRAFQEWKTAFSQFKTTEAAKLETQGDILDLDALALLTEIRSRLDLASPTFAMDFDQFRPEFEQIISVVERIHDLRRHSTQPTTAPHYVSSGGLCFSSTRAETLFYVARYCRYTDLRERVIALLETEDALGSTLATRLYARVSRKLREVEERGWEPQERDRVGCDCRRGEHICALHRIASAQLVYSDHPMAQASVLTAVRQRAKLPMEIFYVYTD